MPPAPQTASTVLDAFARYDEHLKLDADELDAAREMHHSIREILQDAGIISDAFLQGSFARKTMLAPLKDVDMIVIMAAEHDALRDDPAGPSKAEQLIIDALAAEFPHATFDPGRHAVKIDFGDGGFTFDCVPAFEVGNAARDVDIANTDDGTWDRSNTRELIRVTQERNQACGGKWVRQARMLKDFVAKSLHDQLPNKLPGMVSEAICFEAITSQVAHPEALAAALRAGAQMLQGPVQDLTGFDVLTDDLPEHLLATAQARFSAAADAAEQALQLAADGDEAAAVDVWHYVLGDGFPPAPPPSEDDALAGTLSGGFTITGRPTKQRRGAQPARPTRAWRSS